MLYNNLIVGIILLGNRYNHIRYCILSLQNTVDEIVIIHSGKDDATLEKIKSESKIPVHIYYKEWANDYSRQLNYALEKCIGYKWCIKIDDDERLVTPGLREHIKNAGNRIGGFRVNIINPHNSFNGFSIVHSQSTRIFRTDKGFRYRYSVHEDIAGSITNSKYIINNLDPNIAYIYHLGYNIRRAEIKKKSLIRIAECEKMLNESESNNKGLWLYYLGNHYGVIGDIDKMKYYYLKAIQYPLDEEKINSILNTLRKIR